MRPRGDAPSAPGVGQRVPWKARFRAHRKPRPTDRFTHCGVADYRPRRCFPNQRDPATKKPR